MDEKKLPEYPCAACPAASDCRHCKTCRPFRAWFSPRWKNVTAAVKTQMERRGI